MIARRIAPASLVALVLITAAVHPAAAGRCQRGALVGEVTRVRDGDTIVVAGVPVRLQGLAAPERGEPGGAEATAESMRNRGGLVPAWVKIPAHGGRGGRCRSWCGG